MRSLVWFRRDLRISDNAALSQAAHPSAKGIIGLFVMTPQQWKDHDDADGKVSFWLSNLRLLSRELAKLQIPLLVETCDTFDDVPQIVVTVAQKHDCSSLYWNHEYEVNEARRDARVVAACDEAGIEVRQFHDRVIVPPQEIATQDGRFYSVFTPYRRVWDTQAPEYAAPFPRPRRQLACDVTASPVPDQLPGFDFSHDRRDLWEPGETEAEHRLAKFVEKISDYDAARDVPSINGTSRLSPYLAAGVISPRQCLAAALSVNRGKNGGVEGATTWISELTWRDFYTHVMVGFPRVSMHEPFKEKTKAIQWQTDEEEFQAWCQGQTGYPIVDAGMRQLNQTGWMHNRLRMVTAMFLTKHLLIDWRWGERYFMQHLIDGDLAANNGGWQWSASTGTDSVPYFRIFNPFSQSKRFDPEGKFIKKFCPELVAVSSTSLHDPQKLTRAIEEQELSYPHGIVDHKFARERALAEFKSIA